MKKQPPVKVSQNEVVFKVEEIEPILSGPSMDIPHWSPMYITLPKSGKTMVIRELRTDEIPLLIPAVKQLLDVDHDFYDIVGVRVLAELLGQYRNRLKDPYSLVGIIDGEIAAFANGRLMNKDINISLHTLAFMRGMNAGAVMYYAKCYYTFEILKQSEFWATYESYNGWKRWGIGMAQPSYPWPDVQHELGGARVYYVTNEYWKTTVKKYLEDMVGAQLMSTVPEDLLKKSQAFKAPETVEV
jgi:hypothetical protein